MSEGDPQRRYESECYTVTVSDEFDDDIYEGCEREEWRRQRDGKLHRNGDLPSVIFRQKETGHILHSEYHKHGELTRESGPAVTQDNNVRRFEYWVRDKLHREGAPAVREVSQPDGLVTEELYYLEGEPSRRDGPSRVYRDPVTRVVTDEYWEQNGNAHRTDGPALIFRDRINGNLTRQVWMQDDQLHRDPKDGPAEITYDSDSKAILTETYAMNGKIRLAPNGEVKPHHN